MVVDYDTLSFQLDAEASRSGGGEKALHWSRSSFSIYEEVIVQGNGKLHIGLDLGGIFGAQTDRDDGRRLAGVHTTFSVIGADFIASETISNTGPGTVLDGAENDFFSESVSRSFDVSDGDLLKLHFSGTASAGDYPSLAIPREPLESFFFANSSVTGKFSIRGEGIDLTYGDSPLSAVPLPAGPPLLMVGIGGLYALRRKRVHQG
jgi:hypothetical protein